jgi:pSer/pThr/pTyr-binding forkhead associated (FHA) protein
MAAPKTMYLSAAEVQGVAATPGLSLGWLVVLQSPDEKRRGAIFELTAPVSVLSRGVRSATANEEWFGIDDEFVSSGHAIVHRPQGSDRSDSFTIRDRESPGPSANGTFVNSHKLRQGEIAQLSEGDIVRLGTTELIFKSLWLPPGGSRQT